ncbi:MAG: PadR family transcriptional regulator [Gemmatimonadetes bacterium]|nr:PadR family transcriptional regulator [Gemmatimonadota bacterium]
MSTCAEDHLPLHPLEFRILLAVLDGPSYGLRIVEEIEARERSVGTLYPANLYRRIRSLLSDGLLAESSPPEGADTRRTYVLLTPLGREVAVAETARLRDLVAEAERYEVLDGS